jgi:hypothetical protein
MTDLNGLQTGAAVTAPGAASPPPNDSVTAPENKPLPGKGFLAAYREWTEEQPPGTTQPVTDPALIDAAFNAAFAEAARHRSGSPERLAAAWAAEALLRSSTFDGARRRLHRDVSNPGVRDAALAVLDALTGEHLAPAKGGRSA